MHGALLDAELLAEVYIEMIGGKQAALGLEVSVSDERQDASREAGTSSVTLSARPKPLPPRITDEELHAHAEMTEKLGDGAIWKKIGA